MVSRPGIDLGSRAQSIPRRERQQTYGDPMSGRQQNQSGTHVLGQALGDGLGVGSGTAGCERSSLMGPSAIFAASQVP